MGGGGVYLLLGLLCGRKSAVEILWNQNVLTKTEQIHKFLCMSCLQLESNTEILRCHTDLILAPEILVICFTSCNLFWFCNHVLCFL